MTSLPRNDYPVYQFEIPSQHQKFRFRPFTVKENKALLIAQSTDDDKVMADTLNDIIKSCCLDDIQTSTLALFDVEYLLIKLRTISIDNHANVIVSCTHTEDHKGLSEDTLRNEVAVDFNQVEIPHLEDFNTTISLSPKMGVVMKMPSLDLIRSLNSNINDEDIDKRFHARVENIIHSIDKIYNDKEVIEASEVSDEELQTWVEQLNEDQFGLILNYFETIPHCQIKVEWTCPYCGKKNVQYITDLHYFF